MRQTRWKKGLLSMLLAGLVGLSSVQSHFVSTKAEDLSPELTAEAAETEETEDIVSVSDLQLSRTSLNLSQGETAQLSLRIFPEDAQYDAVLWESDDPEVVTVTGQGTLATLTASSVNEGFATVTATVGDCKVSCDVQVSQAAPMLESLLFTAYNSNTDPDSIYDLSDLDLTNKEYELVVPVTKSSVYVWPDLRDDLEDVTITADYIDRSGEAVQKELSTTGGYTQLNFLLASGSLTPTEITITLQAGGNTEIYQVKVYRGLALAGVEFRSQYGSLLDCTPTFDPETRTYDLYIPTGSQTLTITQTPREEAGTSFYVNGQEVSQTYTLENVDDLGQISLGCSDGDQTRALDYVFQLHSLPICTVTFQKSPEQLRLSVYDGEGSLMVPSGEGSYLLTQGETYTYTASATGYVTGQGSLTPQEDMEVSVTLEKIGGSSQDSALEAQWPGVYKGGDNQNVLTADPADSSSNAALNWRREYGSLSGVILVDGMLCAYDETKLMLMDPESGEVIKEANLSLQGQTGLGNKPIYGAGKIFVQLVNGRIQAFDAFTLQSLWLYTNPDGGMLTGGLRYDDGLVYGAYYNSSATKSYLVCLSAEDEDPSSQLEEKTSIWKYGVTGGFYTTSPYTDETNLYIVSYGGQILCLDKTSGYLKQTISLGSLGASGAGLSYYEGRLYFTSLNGYVCSYAITQEGLDPGSLQTLKLGGNSRSTPVIYQNRLYVGYSSGAATTSQPYGSGSYYLAVVDLDSATGAMSLAYQASVTGMLNESATLVLPGEGSESQAAKIYFTVKNGTYAGCYVVWDQAGQTEVSEQNTYLRLSAASTDLATGSIVMDEEGTFYLRSEGGSLLSVSRSELVLQDVKVSDPKAVIDGGSFQPYTDNHSIQVGDGVTGLEFTAQAEEGVSVSINGKEGNQQEISLKEGKAEVTVTLTQGNRQKIYTFQITEKSNMLALTTLFLSNGTNFSTDQSVYSYYPLEELSEETVEYSIRYRDRPSSCYLWVTPAHGDNSLVTVKPVSGCTTTAVIKPVKLTTGTYYKFSLTSSAKEAVVSIQVTAQDGSASQTYQVTLANDITAPVISADKDALSNRLANSVDLTFTASEAGTLYYMLYDSIPTSLPTSSAYRQKGTKAEQTVQEGTNTITLTGLAKTSQYLYAIMQDGAGNWSLYSSPIQLTTQDAPALACTGVELSQTELELEVSSTATLTASLLPLGTTEEAEITWTSDNRNVAQVEGSGSTGKITAKRGGSATITATAQVEDRVYQAVCQVSVPVTVTGITLNTYHLELKVGETSQLTASLLPAELQSAPKIIWRNSNKNYLTLEGQGSSATVTALAQGSATIEVLAGSVRVTCNVTVVTDQEVLKGDVNQDGLVDVFDVALVVDMIRGSSQPDLQRADMDGNGSIDVFDVAAIADLIRQ